MPIEHTDDMAEQTRKLIEHTNNIAKFTQDLIESGQALNIARGKHAENKAKISAEKAIISSLKEIIKAEKF